MALKAAIQGGEWDLILSDYSLPGYDGLSALSDARREGKDIPFIIVSGTIGEDAAVESMRDGAADYLLKDRLTRLGQAVQNVLDEKRNREERQRVEEKLGELRQQHALILDSVGEGIYGIDLEGKINFANPKAAELLGWNAGELLGKSAHDTVNHTRSDGSKYPAEANPILDCLRGAANRVTNDVFWRKKGTSFRVDYVCAPVKDEKGQITGAIVTFKDITEQFMAEARLKLQEQQYRLLFDINPSAMWIFDTKNLDILAVNRAALAQYGYSREEFLKLNIKDLRPAEDVSDLFKARAQYSSVVMSHYSGQFRHKKKDGSLILVEIYSAPITWETTAARIVTAIDVTAGKKNEQAGFPVGDSSAQKL